MNEIQTIREALESALREHDELMESADLPVGSRKIDGALSALARLEAFLPPEGETRDDEDKKNAIYSERNRLAIAFALAVLRSGGTAGVRYDEGDGTPDYWHYVVVAVLPDGRQVGWHMPPVGRDVGSHASPRIYAGMGWNIYRARIGLAGCSFCRARPLLREGAPRSSRTSSGATSDIRRIYPR